MTALDILVLLLVCGLGLLGMSRGFVTEALSLGVWIVAIAAVKLLHGPVSAALSGFVGTDAGAAVLAFALVFGVTMIAGRFAARKIGDGTKRSVIGPLDRVLGLGFGALKGLIGASIVFLVVSLVHDTIYGGKSDRPAWMIESRTYPLLSASAGALVTFVEERRRGGEAEPEALAE